MAWLARVVPLLCLLPLACADTRGQSIFDSGDEAASVEAGDESSSLDSGESGPKLDLGADTGMNDGMAEGGDDCPMFGTSDASISGTVFAPNMEIPVSGALVWASKTKPDGIPQTVYCAECVELETRAFNGQIAVTGEPLSVREESTFLKQQQYEYRLLI